MRSVNSEAASNLADGTPQSGITYQFEYNDQGQLIWQGTPGWDDMTEPKGVVTERFYYGPGDHYGRLEKIVVDPSGLALTTLFEYDTIGNLTKVTDPRTNSTTFAVNEMRELTAVDAPLSVGMKLIRDANGNVVRTEVNRSNDPLAGSITLGAPIVTVSTYDAWNRLISSEEDVTASSTRTWTYTYDGLSNLKTATSPEGRAEKFEYDELNFPWRHTRGLGTPEQSTNITHVDENGRIRQLIDGNGNATDLTYDDYDRVVSVQDPNTDIVTIQYNKRDEVTERTILDGAAARRKVRFDYDQLGRLKEVAEVDVSMSPDSDQVTLFQYAKDSRLDSRQSPRGFDTDFDYDSARRLVSTTDQLSNSSVFELDANGNRTKTTSIEQIPGNPTPEVFVATHDYDELNRLVQNQQVDRLDAMHKLTSTFQYDLRHNPLQVTDSIGRVHTATFDLANRRLSSTEDSANLSITTSLEYDNDNLPVKLTDADGFETTTTFDSKGRSTRVDYDPATGLFESYTYDLGDRLLTHRTQDGVVTTFTYNDDNTLASRSTGTLLESFTWNALDQVITADSSDFIGQAISLSFDYDGFSRLVNENQGTYTVSSDYDASNNRDTCTYPTGGPTLTHTFDALERLSNIQDGSGPPELAMYDYAGRARMNSCKTGPTTQTFGWDGLRRLTDIDAGSVHDLAYGYDDFNRRTFKQFEHLLPTIQGDVYDYDGGSRLSDVWYDDVNPTAGAPGTSLAHLQIQQSKVQARTSTTFMGTSTLYSTGDPLHRTTSIGGVLRTYDDKGNLTDNGTGRKFEYDAWNRMTRVLDGTGTELVRYEFDALGRRYQRIEGGTTTTRYVYDGPRLLEEYVDPGTGTFTLATRYIYGGGLDELIAIETGGQRYYTYRDALGSIEAITDSAGVVVERYDYDAFGVPTVTDGLGVPTPLGIYGEPTSQYGNDLWFTGARWDPESGNYHMRARQYEPLAGRFVSRDPLGYVDGPNAYSYGYSDPANWTDPFGLEAGGSSGGNLPVTGLETSPVIDPNNIPIDPRTGRPPQHLFPYLTPEQRRTPRAAVEAQVASQWAGAYSGTSDTAVMAQDHAMAADADFNLKFTAGGLGTAAAVAAAPMVFTAAATSEAGIYLAPILWGRSMTVLTWVARIGAPVAAWDRLRSKSRLGRGRKSLPKTGIQCQDISKRIGMPRDRLLNRAEDARLRDAIDQLYRKNAKKGNGGSADAFRFEMRTGELLSPSGHKTKLLERRGQLQNLRSDPNLSPGDKSLINEMLKDIQNALSGN